MRKLLLVLAYPLALAGCSGVPVWTAPEAAPLAIAYSNPILVPNANAQYVFDTVADVTGDYFVIDHEEPVRLMGTTLTEGRIETYPKIGATIFEPWDHDSADGYERLECTLQSIRRYALIKVVPVPNGGGFWIDVAVYKELENCLQPEYATAGAATFPYDQTQTRVVNPLLVKDINRGWIPQGRDPVLEQRIMGQLLDRFNRPGG
jgi:hypothetical protein